MSGLLCLAAGIAIAMFTLTGSTTCAVFTCTHFTAAIWLSAILPNFNLSTLAL